jgi:hypothetical protein
VKAARQTLRIDPLTGRIARRNHENNKSQSRSTGFTHSDPGTPGACGSSCIVLRFKTIHRFNVIGIMAGAAPVTIPWVGAMIVVGSRLPARLGWGAHRELAVISKTPVAARRG